ncbi:MAG: hypothetical protein AAF721_23460 [Myxococcota bacterium]
MLARIAQIAVAAAAVTITVSSADMSEARAAFKAVCEHPQGGTCVATRATGSIACSCRGEQHEIDNEDIKSGSDDELMDACWAAFSEVCIEKSEEVATCDEPDRGTCEVGGADGGFANCECEAAGEQTEDGLSDLEDLTGEDLEEACYEQLDRLCVPRTAAATAPPPAPGEPVGLGNSGGGSTLSCSVAPRGALPWSLLLLPLFGLARRRR